MALLRSPLSVGLGCRPPSRSSGWPVPEVARLGRTLSSCPAQVLAYFETHGLSNGSAEAVGLLNEKTGRLAHRDRRFTRYRLRMLLRHGHAPYRRARTPSGDLQPNAGLEVDTAVVVGALEPVTLTTPGLILRPWLPADAEAVTQACQDADIQRWTMVPVPYLPEHGDEFTGTSGQRWAAGLASFGVFDATTGALLGSHGFVARPAPGVVEIGYWTAAEARGRGVATAATRRVVDWALHELAEHRVEWQAEVGNLGSRRVAEKSGFTIEGLLRGRLDVRGQRRDVWIGGLLRGDLT